MTKLHKPERATYSQTVEADQRESQWDYCTKWLDFCFFAGSNVCCP